MPVRISTIAAPAELPVSGRLRTAEGDPATVRLLARAGGKGKPGIYIYDIDNGHSFSPSSPSCRSSAARGTVRPRQDRQTLDRSRQQQAAVHGHPDREDRLEKEYAEADEGGCDRVGVTPDGSSFYASPAAGGTRKNVMLDANTGRLIKNIVAAKCGLHNLIVSNDGIRVYWWIHQRRHALRHRCRQGRSGSKRSWPPIIGVIQPFTVNGSNTRAYINSHLYRKGYGPGFEIGDLKTGKILHVVGMLNLAERKTLPRRRPDSGREGSLGGRSGQQGDAHLRQHGHAAALQADGADVREDARLDLLQPRRQIRLVRHRRGFRHRDEEGGRPAHRHGRRQGGTGHEQQFFEIDLIDAIAWIGQQRHRLPEQHDAQSASSASVPPHRGSSQARSDCSIGNEPPGSKRAAAGRCSGAAVRRGRASTSFSPADWPSTRASTLKPDAPAVNHAASSGPTATH